MRFSAAAIAAASLAVGASAENYMGFNSGATLADRSAKFKKDFKQEFETAQNLEGAPGKFNAVRLYTNIQAYAQDDPIEAFEAAIETDTKILLGVWASGVSNIDKEISALNKAIKKHGKKLTDLIIGVSIGSEDLYRNSVTGVKNDAGVGTDPDVLVGFIDDFKKAFKDSAISNVPLGHVDTWDVWPNATNKAVIDALDFIGVDEYPYYENDKGNDIKNSGQLFDKAYEATIAAANGKPVWVTETGWPTTGPDWDEAVPSVKNAKYYWNEIGCRQLFGKTPTFWYTLRDSNPDNEMKFAITKDLSTKPLFDLSCPSEFETDKAYEKEKESASASSTASVTSSPSGTAGNGSPSTTAGAGNDSDNGNGEDSGSENTEGDENTDGEDEPENVPGSGASSMRVYSAATGLALVAAVLAMC